MAVFDVWIDGVCICGSESTANKATTIIGNETSDIKYLSAKAVDEAITAAGVINSLDVSQLAVTATNYTILTATADSMYEVKLYEQNTPANYLLATAIYSTTGEASHIIQHGTYAISINFSGADLRFLHDAGSNKQLIGKVIKII